MANDPKNQAWKEAVSATRSCLSVEELEPFVGSDAPQASSSKGAAHLAECPHCRTELAMLKKFEEAAPLPDEGAAVAWITAQLQRNQRSSAPSASKSPTSFWRNFFARPYFAAAASLVFVVTLGLVLYIFERPKEPILNAGLPNNQIVRSGAIKLLSPANDLQAPPAEFKWEAFPGATGYAIQVSEGDGNTVWSGKSATTSIVVTPELKSKMHPGKTLLWKATALDATGKAIATSNQQAFKVTNHKK